MAILLHSVQPNLRLVYHFLVLSALMASQCSSLSSIPRIFLITGATDGIGRHTAERLAEDGHHLLVHGRKPDAGKLLSSSLSSRGAASVRYFNADLSDLSEVERLSCEILAFSERIDVLINNAGVFDPDVSHSAQGYETTWHVNVMAPFLLTRKLLPLLTTSAEDHSFVPRIITTSSISQSSSLWPDRFPKLFQRKGPVQSAHGAYSDSKLGDYLFTVRLSQILKESGCERLQRIKCLTMDPGTVNTKMLLAGWGACGITVKSANNTYKLAATELGSNADSGSYHFGGRGSKDSHDPEKLQILWEKLEECTGCTYGDIFIADRI